MISGKLGINNGNFIKNSDGLRCSEPAGNSGKQSLKKQKIGFQHVIIPRINVLSVQHEPWDGLTGSQVLEVLNGFNINGYQVDPHLREECRERKIGLKQVSQALNSTTCSWPGFCDPDSTVNIGEVREVNRELAVVTQEKADPPLVKTAWWVGQHDQAWLDQHNVKQPSEFDLSNTLVDMAEPEKPGLSPENQANRTHPNILNDDIEPGYTKTPDFAKDQRAIMSEGLEKYGTLNYKADPETNRYLGNVAAALTLSDGDTTSLRQSEFEDIPWEKRGRILLTQAVRAAGNGNEEGAAMLLREERALREANIPI